MANLLMVCQFFFIFAQTLDVTKDWKCNASISYIFYLKRRNKWISGNFLSLRPSLGTKTKVFFSLFEPSIESSSLLRTFLITVCQNEFELIALTKQILCKHSNSHRFFFQKYPGFTLKNLSMDINIRTIRIFLYHFLFLENEVKRLVCLLAWVHLNSFWYTVWILDILIV